MNGNGQTIKIRKKKRNWEGVQNVQLTKTIAKQKTKNYLKKVQKSFFLRLNYCNG